MGQTVKHQVITDNNGKPLFAVLPYAEFQRLMQVCQARSVQGIPTEVTELVAKHNWTLIRAWRKYLGLTQGEVADKMGITQAAYSQHENKQRSLRRATRAKIAVALGIKAEQLDF